MGRLADGWVPSLPYAPPPVVPELQARIDAGAAKAGRDPAEIRRVYNLIGEISEPGDSDELLAGPVSFWIETLTGFVLDLGFDTLIFWPRGDTRRQLALFTEDVAPAVRAEIARARA